MNFYSYTKISSVYLIKLPHFFEDNGDLVVMEGLENVPFTIARVFVVRAPVGAVRGQHSHKACAQFLTCTSGTVEVKCNDGIQSVEFELSHPNIGLYIPPGIWAEQKYKSKDATLTVLCDRVYEKEDYIRDYESYLNYQKNLLENSKTGRKIEL